MESPLWEEDLGKPNVLFSPHASDSKSILYRRDVGTGLLLGGGLSYLSGEHGFSADGYRELDVVLVSGELVTATSTNAYADLFRSLKGGANRFGIVTRYEVEAIHTGTNLDKNWFGGIIMVGDNRHLVLEMS